MDNLATKSILLVHSSTTLQQSLRKLDHIGSMVVSEKLSSLTENCGPVIENGTRFVLRSGRELSHGEPTVRADS
jgi:hypothetical protein